MNRKYLILQIVLWNFIVSFSAMGYPWPLKPENTQKKVTDVLNACRGRRDHFHDGIDIGNAPENTPVYAVEAGTAYRGGNGKNSYVKVIGTNIFWYVHLKNRIAHGSEVSAGEKLGEINSENHLHFAEGPHEGEINPLRRRGGISPFKDTDNPTIEWIRFYKNETTTEIPADKLPCNEQIHIVVKVRDKITNGGEKAGIYEIGYALESNGDYGTEINYTASFQFKQWLESTHIKKVYFEGSNTSDYRYIITNYEIGGNVVD